MRRQACRFNPSIASVELPRGRREICRRHRI